MLCDDNRKLDLDVSLEKIKVDNSKIVVLAPFSNISYFLFECRISGCFCTIIYQFFMFIFLLIIAYQNYYLNFTQTDLTLV